MIEIRRHHRADREARTGRDGRGREYGCFSSSVNFDYDESVSLYLPCSLLHDSSYVDAALLAELID